MSKSFLAAVLVLGAAVSVTVVPGIFTIDDGNYLVNVLALRQGRVTIANTESLPPSAELLFFDPGPWTRTVQSTPVASSAPPLYAPLALPFSFAGWRGLVALNTLAFMAATVLVFQYALRHGSESAAWTAAGAFALGGFIIEYAQGVWPHALSVALCFGGVAALGRVIDRQGASFAAMAGFLLGLATGVRYQNAVILGVAGMATILWSRERIKHAVMFGLAAAVPLVAAGAMNYERLGSWNPISKGPGYINIPLIAGTTTARWFDPAIMFWARVVDFSVRPRIAGATWDSYDPSTGAHFIGLTLQKALLQSAPWAIIGIIVFLAAWIPSSTIRDDQRRQLRFLSLIAAAVTATFAVSGVQRHEGVSYNQRYLLELVPMLAVAFAWAIDALQRKPRVMLLAAWLGAGTAIAVLWAPPGYLRTILLLTLPLIASAVLALTYALARRVPIAAELVQPAACFCLAWALSVHLADDVVASRRLRSWKKTQTDAMANVLTDGAALVTYGNKDVAIPLLFDRDIVIVDTQADEARDAPALIRDLFGRHRRVFVHQTGFTPDAVAKVVDGWQIVPIAQIGTSLLELRARPR